MRPTKKTMASSMKKVLGSSNELKEINLPERELNVGKNNAIKPMLSNKAINAVNVDSTRNCATNWDFEEPVTFLIPISFALLAERAVVRFM